MLNRKFEGATLFEIDLPVVFFIIVLHQLALHPSVAVPYGAEQMV